MIRCRPAFWLLPALLLATPLLAQQQHELTIEVRSVLFEEHRTDFNHVTITGITNLPDSTLLEVVLQGGVHSVNGWREFELAQAICEVKEGKFEAVLNRFTAPLPPAHEYFVLVRLCGRQRDEVEAVLQDLELRPLRIRTQYGEYADVLAQAQAYFEHFLLTRARLRKARKQLDRFISLFNSGELVEQPASYMKWHEESRPELDKLIEELYVLGRLPIPFLNSVDLLYKADWVIVERDSDLLRVVGEDEYHKRDLAGNPDGSRPRANLASLDEARAKLKGAKEVLWQEFLFAVGRFSEFLLDELRFQAEQRLQAARDPRAAWGAFQKQFRDALRGYRAIIRKVKDLDPPDFGNRLLEDCPAFCARLQELLATWTERMQAETPEQTERLQRRLHDAEEALRKEINTTLNSVR